jgi:hypothetical protein
METNQEWLGETHPRLEEEPGAATETLASAARATKTTINSLEE